MSRKLRRIFFLIIILISISSVVLAIFKTLTIGEKKLSFSIIIEGNTEEPQIQKRPILSEGMIPIIWDDTYSKWKITSSTDESWYNYEEKKWANVMMSDGTYNSSTSVNTLIEENQLGSMFVWIPRFEYKINYTSTGDHSQGGTISINLIESSVISSSEGYTIHPAFTNGTYSNFLNGEWDNEIAGFWVAKFEMSKEIYSSSTKTWISQNTDNDSQGNIIVNNTSTRMVSKPNKSAWSRISVANAYNSSLKATYNENNADNINSHMLKNSEWGAVAYLAYSSYGKQSQPSINNILTSRKKSVTGYSSGNTQARMTDASANNNNKYSTQIGIKASTTGNIYGVYDMNGGLNEYTSAYFEGNSNPIENNSKYCTVYQTGSLSSVGKIGDATKEVFKWDNSAMGSEGSTNPAYTSSMYFMRGGAASNGDSISLSGIFSAYQLNSSTLSYYRGFRTSLIVE